MSDYSQRIDNLDDQMEMVFHHIEVTNGELGCVKEDVAQLKADSEWLKWAVKWIMVGIGGTVFITLINIVLGLIGK